MSIVKGIKSATEGYIKNFYNLSATEPKIFSETYFSTNNEEDCIIKIANEWPENIFLKAMINPINFSEQEDVTIEYREGKKIFASTSLYRNPKFDSSSQIQDLKNLCSQIDVVYEGNGEIFINHETEKFKGNTTQDYFLDLKDNILFKKEFLTEHIKNIVDDITPKMENGSSSVRNSVPKTSVLFLHPYGGYYKLGDHPRNIESCIFYSTFNAKNTVLKAFTLKNIQSLGIDPFQNQILRNQTHIIGIKNFTESQKLNLYDEIKSGKCVIDVTNRNIKEICRYKSVGLEHFEGTNIIKIKFEGEKK